jgi:hypothetical protein
VAASGAVVPAGAEVRGFIDGSDCTQLGDNYRPVTVADGVSTYAIEVVHESQVPGCGAQGRTVTFTVNGVAADQSVAWTFGPTRIDLTLAGGQALPLPTATPPATTPQQAITATATAGAAFTPRAGTPPVDNVDPGDLFGGASSATPSAPSAGEPADGSSAFLPLALGTILIAGVGGLGGWLLARRKRPAPPG